MLPLQRIEEGQQAFNDISNDYLRIRHEEDLFLQQHRQEHLQDLLDGKHAEEAVNCSWLDSGKSTEKRLAASSMGSGKVKCCSNHSISILMESFMYSISFNDL